MTTRYDESCYALAEDVLERRNRRKTQIDVARAERLAVCIQAAIDDFLRDEMDDAREAGRSQ